MSGNRSIFEDVGQSAPQERPVTASPSAGTKPGLIILWLKALFVLVALMIVIGGLTRLTDSGLSITEWAPIKGMIPPMSDAAWQLEFEKYQTIPEFQIQNASMTLGEFKYIYWWEWGHRQLGRFVGLVWAVGFAVFVLRKAIPRGWTTRLFILGVLGGLQGAIGWWMVSSGLEGRMVDVASYRLATHLGLAFVILGVITWFILGLSRGDAELLQARRRRESGFTVLAALIVTGVFLQILLGALVAGLDAGRGYTDWPLMGGQLVPDGMFNLTPWLTNFFENVALTQFNHRILGYLVFGLVLYSFWKSLRSSLAAVRYLFKMVAIFTVLQVLIGIVTVMNAAPLGLAIFHQFGAIVLWVLVFCLKFEVLYPRQQSLR